VLFAYELNRPIERYINDKYVKKAKDKLSNHKNLVKIAITGSYGKTTVKNILNQILSTKYNVLITPKSYNTPMGLVKTIKRLNNNHEIFISEMGARRVGDIKYLSSIFRQDIAVITGITTQHLETFFTIDNIIKAKGEIIENFSGEAFFSADCSYTYDMYKNANCSKFLAGATENSESICYAKDIISNENGSKFVGAVIRK
jgi:UDP-N-acetylmuramoyl-tripeptide--D-alanyl-D-alanine ligase